MLAQRQQMALVARSDQVGAAGLCRGKPMIVVVGAATTTANLRRPLTRLTGARPARASRTLNFARDSTSSRSADSASLAHNSKSPAIPAAGRGRAVAPNSASATATTGIASGVRPSASSARRVRYADPTTMPAEVGSTMTVAQRTE